MTATNPSWDRLPVPPPDAQVLASLIASDLDRLPTSRDCPVTWVLTRIGGAWSLPVMVRLGLGGQRFRELQREMTGVSARMLTRTLRTLQADGLVTRNSEEEDEEDEAAADVVTYRLTSAGRSMVWALKPLVEWADSTGAALRREQAARAARDAAAPAGRVVRLLSRRPG